jgi:putative transposase
VAWLCEALGVSRSGFHAWYNCSPSERARYDEVLLDKITQSFKSSDRTYGTRRVWHDVLEEGLFCGLHRIERLMRSHALRARPRRLGLPKDAGNRAVIDLFSRRVVGWSMNANMTAQLVTDALIMAIWRRGKPDALLHHSDQGSQGRFRRSSQHRFGGCNDGSQASIGSMHTRESALPGTSIGVAA